MAKRLHLFSLFFSVLTFSNLGKEVCRSAVSRHDLEFPRWSVPCCGDTLPYSSAAMFFFYTAPAARFGPSARRVSAVGTTGAGPRHICREALSVAVAVIYGKTLMAGFGH